MNDQLSSEILAICRLFAAFEKEQICCGGVTVAQCVVLQALYRRPSEAAVLAQEGGVSPSAMTRLLDGLAKKGWVERVHNRDDRRRITVQLTFRGKKEARRLLELTQNLVEAVLSEIPKKKRLQVVESTRLLREAFERCRADWAS